MGRRSEEFPLCRFAFERILGTLLNLALFTSRCEEYGYPCFADRVDAVNLFDAVAYDVSAVGQSYKRLALVVSL